LDSNIEVGVQFAGEGVTKLISWFDAFWKKATSLDLPKLSNLEYETEALRRAYAALRRKVGAMQPLSNEAAPSVRSPSKLRDVLKNGSNIFVCNTNRRNSPGGENEDQMRASHFATAWTQFVHPSHMKRVEPGDTILMFAKGFGIIGVGRAKARVQVLPPGDPARIISGYPDEEEWRVPIDEWLAWADHEQDAYPWAMPNATFLDVSGEKYRELREGACEHFLRGT
jgi:hypothetical protein